MRKEKQAEQQKIDSSLLDSTNPCDCCSELLTLQPVTTRMDVEENKIEDEEHGHINSQKKKQLLSDKLIIITGLVLTISIVLLELLLPHSPTTEFIMLALATPVQILLGRPFYYRFFQTVKYRKRFTLLSY